MRIHKVRKPFMSRIGQFEEDKHSLCIGLDTSALMATDIYRCYLGNNETVYYEIDTREALEYARTHTIWTNKEGRKVAILPIFLFKKLKGGDNL